MARSRGALLLLLATALAAGCAGVPGDEGTGADTSCAGEATRPISQTVLTKTLKRHGFTVHADPRDVICSSSDPVFPTDPDEDMPVSVSNILFEGRHENIESHDEISRREGHVNCGLRRGPIWGSALEKDLDAPPASPIFSGDKATFSVANVECTLYPDGPRSGEQVRNLDRAMEELARLAK